MTAQPLICSSGRAVANAWGDQADGLRALVGTPHCRSISISGGRDSSGATTVAVNLAAALARHQQHVMLLDEYLGAGNALSRLKLSAQSTLDNVIQQGRPLNDLVIPGPAGIEVLSVHAHPNTLAQLAPERQKRLAQEFDLISNRADYLLLDTRPAAGHGIPCLALAADDILIVISNRAESITDAYATIKLLHQEFGRKEFWILANRINHLHTAQRLFTRLREVARQYGLQVKLRLMGFVPEDEKLHRANRLSQPVIHAFPQAESSIAFDQLAEAMLRWPHSPQHSHSPTNIIYRLVESSRLFADRLSA